jgi:hypothetical protein
MWIEFEDPEDLSGFLEVIRDAENACSREIGNLHRQMRLERQSAPEGTSRIGLIVRAEESEYWNGRMRWLHASRLCLESSSRARRPQAGVAERK